MDLDNEAIVALLAKRDESAFEQVFKLYFKNLHAYACVMLKEDDFAEEIVQQVFLKLWERTENITISSSVAAYLYRAVHNECLNYLKHQKVKAAHRLHVAYSMKQVSTSAFQTLQAKELEKKLHCILNELPEQCRTIFQMSRFEELKYREIADQLRISVKTVENQMGKALRILREQLTDYLPFLFLFLNF
ncbi:MAG: RNA polymerase sigma-70 factor [Ferruginibacter sp.]|nr:RNA polymerase sigma-70 factor [Ferruginibacter sp.]